MPGHLGLRAPGDFLSPPHISSIGVQGLQMCVIVSGVSVGAVDPSLGPDVCIVSVLPTEMSLQPLT